MMMDENKNLSPWTREVTRGGVTTDARREFWRMMMGMYGADRWAKAYGEQIPQVWADSLDSMTLEEAKMGVDACMKTRESFLPTLAQFEGRVMDAMKLKRERAQMTEHHGEVDTHAKLLEHQKTHGGRISEIAQREIAKQKRINKGLRVDMSDNPTLSSYPINPTSLKCHDAGIRIEGAEEFQARDGQGYE